MTNSKPPSSDSVDPGDTCPVCDRPKATSGRGSPARYCASARTGRTSCRKKAHREKHGYEKRFAKTHLNPPPPNTVATMAIRDRFAPETRFSVDDALRAAAAWGVHLSWHDVRSLLIELVDEVAEQDAHPDGTSAFFFLSCRDTRRVAKRGAQVAACHGEGDALVARSQGDDVAPGQLGTPPAPKARRRRQASLSAFSLVRVVAPPTVDGGTSFSVEAPRDRWCPALLSLWAAGRPVKAAAVDLVTPDGEVLSAEIRQGQHGQVSVIFLGDAQLDLFPGTGRARLMTKANALWGSGLAVWMRRWFDVATSLLLGTRCEHPATAHDVGWRTSTLELAADFTGLTLVGGDVVSFAGTRGGPKRVDSHGFKRDGTVETLEMGQRRANGLAIETHDKTALLIAKKRMPARSIYAATWEANGWDRTASVRRVEARASGSALRLRSKKGGARALDLRNPGALLDHNLLDAFWRHATERYKLVMPPTRAGSRLRRQPTDPRWAAVQRAGGSNDCFRYVFDRREARLRSLEELRIEANGALLRAVARAVGLSDGGTREARAEKLIDLARVDPDFDRIVRSAEASRGRRT